MFSLFEAFKSIKNEKEFENFLIDLCTPNEIKDLKDRFVIVQYLYKNELSQRAIAELVGCSLNTVSRVSRFLNQENYKGYKIVLDRLNQANQTNQTNQANKVSNTNIKSNTNKKFNKSSNHHRQ